ncbi:MAG: HAMP domain-containing protein [Planctomycetota bacterium]|nr:MAG: HAMP domain-containing protein [Planctomycetota bacterium]
MNLSFASRLAIGAAVILLTQVGVGISYLIQVEFNRATERSLSAQRRALAASVREAEANLAGLSQPVLELALDARVRRAINQHFSQPQQLEEAVARFKDRSGGRFQRVIMVGLDGETVLDRTTSDDVQDDRVHNHAHSEWFTGAALAGAMRAAGGPVFLSTAVSEDGHAVLRNSVFLYNDDGIGVGVLMAETPLHTILHSIVSPTLGQRYILDHNAALLASQPLAEQFPLTLPASNTPQAEVRRIDGRWYILSQATIRPPAQAALRWQVVDVVPRDQAAAAFITSTRPLWIGGMSGAVISIVLIMLFSRRLVRPLRQLSQEAQQAGTTLPSSATVTVIDHAGPEIHTMSAAFHAMHQRISDSYALIEQQVEELETSQNQLIQREEDLATTLQSLSEALITVDPAGSIDRFNPAAETLLGIDAAEAVGQPIKRILQLYSDDDSQTPLADPLQAIHQDHGRGTLRLFTPQSPQVHWIAARAAPIRDRHGQAHGTVVVLMDMSEQRNLQAQLVQAQKMEAIGRLAGGVAHDFNNLLASMLGFSERLAARLTSADERRMIGHIMDAGKRAHTLVDQLLTFARQRKHQDSLVNLAAVVRTTCELLRHTGHGENHIEVDITGACWMIGDPAQLESTVLNLGINALDAMSQRPHGVLHISLNHQQHDLSGRLSSQEHGILLLRVSDQGEGMDEETIASACDPFFTTKEPGKGTGLGLASVYGCVQHLGGWMDIESTPQQGTTITLAFPAHNGPHAQLATPVTKPLDDLARVMLVSTSMHVQSQVRKACENCNIHCHVIDKTEEVLSSYRTNTPQLVLLDYTTLETAAWNLIERLHKEHNAAVVMVIVDAHQDKDIEASLYERGIYSLLHMPLTENGLQSSLSQGLAHHRRWSIDQGETT